MVTRPYSWHSLDNDWNGCLLDSQSIFKMHGGAQMRISGNVFVPLCVHFFILSSMLKFQRYSFRG